MNWLLAKVVRPILIIAGIVALFYLIAVAALFGEQRSMLFAGAGVRCPSDIPVGYRAVQFSTSDGQLSSALYRPATAGHRTILFFHGNGDTARTGIALFEPLTTGGHGALLIEYPGYCANPGSPDEQGFYQEGEAAVSWLRRSGVDPSDLIVAGYSLGTGVATKVAADHPPAENVMELLLLIDAAKRASAAFDFDDLIWWCADALARHVVEALAARRRYGCGDDGRARGYGLGARLSAEAQRGVQRLAAVARRVRQARCG